MTWTGDPSRRVTGTLYDPPNSRGLGWGSRPRPTNTVFDVCRMGVWKAHFGLDVWCTFVRRCVHRLFPTLSFGHRRRNTLGGPGGPGLGSRRKATRWPYSHMGRSLTPDKEYGWVSVPWDLSRGRTGPRSVGEVDSGGSPRSFVNTYESLPLVSRKTEWTALYRGLLGTRSLSLFDVPRSNVKDLSQVTGQSRSWRCI